MGPEMVDNLPVCFYNVDTGRAFIRFGAFDPMYMLMSREMIVHKFDWALFSRVSNAFLGRPNCLMLRESIICQGQARQIRMGGQEREFNSCGKKRVEKFDICIAFVPGLVTETTLAAL